MIFAHTVRAALLAAGTAASSTGASGIWRQMDLDLGEIGAGAFRDKVRELLASRPFAQAGP